MLHDVNTTADTDPAALRGSRDTAAIRKAANSAVAQGAAPAGASPGLAVALAALSAANRQSMVACKARIDAWKIARDEPDAPGLFGDLTTSAAGRRHNLPALIAAETAADNAAREALTATIKVAPGNWIDFLVQLELVRRQSDDLLDFKNPSEARRLTKEKGDWFHTRRFKAIYRDVEALAWGRKATARAAAVQGAAIERLQRAVQEYNDASANWDRLHTQFPKWPQELMIRHDDHDEQVMGIEDIVQHFPRSRWEDLARLLFSIEDARAVYRANATAEQIEAGHKSDDAVNERDDAAAAVLMTAGSASVIPLKMRIFADCYIDVPLHRSRFDLTNPEHLDWAARSGDFNTSSIVPLLATLYRHAVALASREGPVIEIPGAVPEDSVSSSATAAEAVCPAMLMAAE